ncbi:MAG: hypothetical protein KG028_05750 [Actinobacteria bacterium]|jgi:hypothetical protein|nr:hypothetical protein [Actinomycetota bacterium]
MTTPRPLPVAALCAALLVASACTSNDDGGEQTPPPSSSANEETANGDEAPSGLDEETAVGRYVALQHAIIQLAPIDPDDIDVEGAGYGIVTEGSPAAQFLTDRLTTMAETGTGPSGEVVDAEVLELRDAGQQATGELCVLQETEPVELSTGEATEGAPAQSDARYLRIEVTYAYVDDGWLIDELPGLEDDGRPDDCVPPSIEQAVQANWEAHDEAGRRWIDSGFAIEERAALKPLVTEERWKEIEAIEPEVPAGRVRGDIVYGLELLSATRTEVVGEWCIDGSRDPDATTISNGEVVPNEDRLLTRGRWQLENGEWLVAMYDESEGDQTILEGTFDAPEGHRCL